MAQAVASSVSIGLRSGRALDGGQMNTTKRVWGRTRVPKKLPASPASRNHQRAPGRKRMLSIVCRNDSSEESPKIHGSVSKDSTISSQGSFAIQPDDVLTASQSGLLQQSRLAVQAISQLQDGLISVIRNRSTNDSGAPAEDWPEQPPPDLNRRWSISQKIDRQAREIFEAAEQCTTVEKKASDLCHCYQALRQCCSELHYEIQQSVAEAAFWRNGIRGVAEVRLQEAREEAAEAEKRGKHLGRNKKGLTPSQVEAIGEWQKAVKATSALQDKIIHLIELERSGEEEETTDEIWIDSDGQLQIRWRKESAKKSRFFSTRIDRKVNRVGWPWLPKGVTVSEERKAAVMEEAFREMRDVYEDLQRELARSAAEAESLRRASLETWTREGGQSGDDDKR